MFSKSKDDIKIDDIKITPVNNSKKNPGIPSIISSGLTIVGNLTSEGELQIDGKVEGDIKCTKIVIGASGAVKGAVEADDAKIHGTLTGKVLAKVVLLGASARVIGDVTHESLAVEPGAYIEGHCMRIDRVKDAPRENNFKEPKR